jgi:D-beta-D-heptose 7-phosphate kinase/D-beta-D-heptose 1-phosphate adenosyltransferase
VLVDPARIPDYSKYKGAYLVTPNREEATLASGLELADKTGKSHIGNLEKATGKFINELNLAAAIVTLHHEGIFLKKKGKKGRIFSTRPRAAYDVTGAGDMVLAMLGATVAAGLTLEDAASLANVAGGLEVERIGVVPLTRQEILAELAGASAHETRKIKAGTELMSLLAEHRRRNERVVFTNGCFDVLHAGHIKFLHFARSQGDVLVVGLNSDASVKKIKGLKRPIYTERERAQMLSALTDVDYVVIFAQPTPAKLIQAVNPDVLVKGEDWKEKGVVGRKFVEARGGKVILAPLIPGLSSSDIIRRVRTKADN